MDRSPDHRKSCSLGSTGPRELILVKTILKTHLLSQVRFFVVMLRYAWERFTPQERYVPATQHDNKNVVCCDGRSFSDAAFFIERRLHM